MKERQQSEVEQLNQRIIAGLCDEFRDYDGVREFVTAVNESLWFLRQHYKLQFIRLVFRFQGIETTRACNAVLFRKMAKHWQNVCMHHLMQGDFQAYMVDMSTISKIRIMIHYFENQKTQP
jgi:hypothetical protein